MKKQGHLYLMVLSCLTIMSYTSLLCGTGPALATNSPSPLKSKNISSAGENTIKSPKKKGVEADTSKPANPASSVPDESKPISPMAEKHIFSPDPDIIGENNDIMNGNQDGKGNDVQQSVDALMQKVKREMELTGIIITPESKKAMIVYKGKGAKEQTAQLYDVGASIDIYLLKDVFPNYVVIAQNNLEVKLGLFQERANRPDQPKDVGNYSIGNKGSNGEESTLNSEMINVENQPNTNVDLHGENIPNNVPKPPPIPLKEANAQGVDNSFRKSIQDGNASDASNPFARALQGAASQGGATSGSSGNTNSRVEGGDNMGANPFLQAIQRARERQQSQQQ